MTITLQSGAVAQGTLTSQQLTLAQIQAAGIDTSDPANQTVINFDVNLSLVSPAGTPQTITFTCNINSAGQFVGGDCGGTGGGGGGGGGWSCSSGGCQSSGASVTGEVVDGHPLIQWLILRGKAAILKQFFDVSMVVTNLSPEPFELTGGQATLDIPDGMSLAPTAVAQSLTQTVPTIAGDASAETDWIIRGDVPGSYNLSAIYTGTLQPFAAPVSITAGLAQPLQVWGANALGLSVQADSGSLVAGHPYHVTIGLTNEANVPLYNVTISLDSSAPTGFIFQPDEHFNDEVAELDPGQTVYSHDYILVPDADSAGSFDPALSSATFAGLPAVAGSGITSVSPPTLYTLAELGDAPGMVHLHWQAVPGATGYEVFSTPTLDTPFPAAPLPVAATAAGATETTLPAGATDAYIAASTASYFAVSSIVDGIPTLEHPVIAAAPGIGGGLSPQESLGQSNPAEAACSCSTGWQGDPVNTDSGDYSETSTDAAIPGNGPSLDATRTYNSLGASEEGAFGYGWSWSYGAHLTTDPAGDVTVTQASGAQVTFAPGPNGTYTAASRVIATLTKSGAGLYTFVVDKRLTYNFDPAGQLTSITDLNGYTTTVSNPDSQHIVVTDASGRALTYTLTDGLVSSLADPAGNTTHFAYDSAGNLISATDPLGRTTSYTYDPTHRLLTLTDPRGGTVTNTYDAEGRVTKQVDPLGRTTTFDYTTVPNTTLVTDPRGIVTADTYTNGFLTSRTEDYGKSDSATWTYTYDPVTGGRTSTVDPLANKTTTAYDADGNVLSQTDPLGHTTTHTYDTLNDLTSTTDPLGNKTSYTYDAAGNETSESATAGGKAATTSYAYTAAPGEVTATTDPDGNVTDYTYDAAGDRTSITNADSDKTVFAYDQLGRETSQTTPTGHTTSYTYDADGELLKKTDPLGHTTTYTYDADGNETSTTDSLGDTTSYTYDTDNEQTLVTRPDGSVLKTTYDADGNVLAQTDGAGNTTSYTYDSFNRVSAATDPDQHMTRYTYDADGHELTQISPAGTTTSYTYNADGQVTKSAYSDGVTPTVTETYDADGHRLTLTDGTGTSTFSYDALGRLTNATDGSGASVAYTYDPASRLTSLTYPNGKVVTYDYDPAGRLTSIVDWLGHTTTFQYDPDGNLTAQHDPNNVSTTTAYDSTGAVTAITDATATTTLAHFDYARDADGRVISETSPSDPGGVVDYTYNKLGELTNGGGSTYGYDAADNPTTFGGAAQTFDPANELLTSGTQASTPPSSQPQGGTTPTQTTGGGTPTQTGTQTTQTGPAGSTGHTGTSSSSPAPKVTQVVTGKTVHGTGKATVTLPISTPGNLALAFVTATGPATQRVASISGGGMHWSPVASAHGPNGLAEVFSSHEKGKRGSSDHVTVTLKDPGSSAAITIVALSSSAAVTGHVAGASTKGAPAVRVTAPPGSLTFAVAHDASSATPTLVGGAALVEQHGSSWLARSKPVTQGASFKIGASAPKNPPWQLVAVVVDAGATASVADVKPATNLAAAPAATTNGPAISHSVLEAAANAETTFAYNADGDRTGETNASGTVAMRYDGADRLIAVGSSITYTYNGDGLRTDKDVTGANTHYVWDQTSSTPDLLEAGSTYYVYGPTGLAIEQITGSVPTYLYQDEQGSTRMLADTTGAIVGSYYYDSWGGVASHSGDSTDLGYDGQIHRR